MSIKILGEPTPHPNVCRFLVDHPIYPGGTINCQDAAMAAGSPLLEALFALGNIEQVMLKDSVITVEKSGHEAWSTVGKRVGAAIREAILSGQPMVSEHLAPDRTHEPQSDDAILRQVQLLLLDTINPAVASHGGEVEVLKVEQGDVYLQMGGGCQGCGAAAFTLQMSVERILRSNIPEIRKIIDLTDHAAGENPYF